MATPGTLKSLARIGYVRSIADQYEEQTPDVSDALRNLLSGLRSHCDAAMMCWPGKLDQHDLHLIGAMLLALGDSTPLGKRRDITTYTAFGLCLLEDMTPMLKTHKKKAVDLVKHALLAVHHHFTDRREHFLCLKSGAAGADAWSRSAIG